MFGFSRFGSGFSPFLAEQVRDSGLLEGLERIHRSVLVDNEVTNGFKWILSSSKQFKARYMWVWSRHVFAKGPDCPVLESYQKWFCQKFLKNAKIKSNSEVLVIFGQKLLKNAKKLEARDFSATRCGFSQKIAKYSLFDCYFWRFWEIFGKTISGNTVRKGYRNDRRALMSGLNLHQKIK